MTNEVDKYEELAILATDRAIDLLKKAALTNEDICAAKKLSEIAYFYKFNMQLMSGSHH